MGNPRGAASLRRVSDGLGFLASPGELGALIAQNDWSATPLGPLERWPHSLRTAVSLMLNSRHPMWIGWGPQATFLYNDAYVEVLGEAKHPWALGRPADEVWAEVWDFCGPLADKVLLHGEASYVDDVQLFINRAGFLEEAWYSFSYSPITDESGQAGGLFCPTTDVTATNLTARRLATVSRLSASALGETTVAGACATAVAALAANPADIPFALLYLADPDGRHAVLQAVAGVAPCTELAPSQVVLDGEAAGAPFPVAEVLRTGQPRIAPIGGLAGLPCGLARQPLSQAVLLPLAMAGRAQPVGVLVAGVSAVRRLDADYLSFFELVAGQVASAVEKASGAEEQARRAATLADLDRAKDEFLAMLGHELRNPLSPILIALDLLRLKNVRGAEKEHAIIERQAQHLVRLVDDLLDVARIARGKIELRPERAELSRLVAQAVETTSPLFEERCHRLHLDVPNTGLFVMADPMRFTQVLSNLLTNAAKYTNPCGQIDLRVRAEDGQAVIEVADNGIGIAPETLPLLFDKFVQERQALDRSRGGLGLGLAIVRS
ncbi:MAG TPA: ATP-binding protein, partial [Telluria sp.]|nr:ATP-binding protein [Telluria sp.]